MKTNGTNAVTTNWVNKSCNLITSINPILFIRIINALFICGLTFSYWSTLWEHYEYMTTASDFIWFMHDKVFILLVYLVLLFYVKDTELRWEIYICVCFSILRIAWQIWEIADRRAANSDMVQLALCTIGSFLVIYLVLYRVLLFLFHKK